MTCLSAAALTRRFRQLSPALWLGLVGGLAILACDVPLRAAPQATAGQRVEARTPRAEVPAQGAETRPVDGVNAEATDRLPAPSCNATASPVTTSAPLTAGLALDVLDMNRAGEHPEVWEAVIRKLRTGAMPPAGRPRPDNATYDAVVAWIETELDRAALANPDPGRPTLHRLNRTEYRNAIRDLLAVDIDAALLPADNAAYGFRQQRRRADPVVGTDGALPGRCGADRGDGARPPAGHARAGDLLRADRPRPGYARERRAAVRLARRCCLPLLLPADGVYLFQMRPKESGVAGGFEGVTDEPHELHVRIDGERVWTGIVQRPPGRARERAQPADPGEHAVRGAGARRLAYRAGVLHRQDVGLRRGSVRSRSAPGPLPGGRTASRSSPAWRLPGRFQEPPAAGDSPGRRKLLVCTPASAAEEGALCAHHRVDAWPGAPGGGR